MSNPHCKGKCRGGVIEAIFADIVLQIPKKSFGGTYNSVDSIDNHAEIMCLLLAHSEIIFRDLTMIYMYIYIYLKYYKVML